MHTDIHTYIHTTINLSLISLHTHTHALLVVYWPGWFRFIVATWQVNGVRLSALDVLQAPCNPKGFQLLVQGSYGVTAINNKQLKLGPGVPSVKAFCLIRPVPQRNHDQTEAYIVFCLLRSPGNSKPRP